MGYPNCTGGENGGGGSGGGIYNIGDLTASFLTIQSNQTNLGYSENEPGGMGGGIANLGNLTISNSMVEDNSTSPGGNGGGIYLGADETYIPETLIKNTELISNTSSANGGGLYAVGSNVQLDNLVVAGNRVNSWQLGNGLFLADHEIQINNLTLAGNARDYGSGVYVLSATAVITNSIIAGQHTGITVAEGGNVSMESTLWGADAWGNTQDWVANGVLITGTHNLHADPFFVDPTTMDFHLSDLSPAVDAGLATGLDVDMDNQIRPNPSTWLPDIGADEVWAEMTPVASVVIEATAPITVTLPTTLTAIIQPLDATPMVSYFWFPSPLSGQGTAEAIFAFDRSGAQDVTVWAINAGGQVTSTLSVDVQPIIRSYYLPLINMP